MAKGKSTQRQKMMIQMYFVELSETFEQRTWIEADSDQSGIDERRRCRMSEYVREVMAL